MLRSLALATLLAALAPEGCELDLFREDFDYELAEHHWMPDGARDSLLYVEVYSGISAPNAARGAGALQGLVERRRVYPPGRGFLHADLDRPIEPDDYNESPREQSFLALGGQLRSSVEVVDAGLFLAPDGKLWAWRETRVRDLQRTLDALDAVVSAAVLESLAREDREPSFPWLDGASTHLARERAQAGGPWVCIVEGHLALDWPLSAAGAARALQRISARDGEPPLPPELTSQIASLTCSDGRALLVLGRGSQGGIHIESRGTGTREGPDVDLIEALRSAKLPIEGPDACKRARMGVIER